MHDTIDRISVERNVTLRTMSPGYTYDLIEVAGVPTYRVCRRCPELTAHDPKVWARHFEPTHGADDDRIRWAEEVA